MLDFLDGSFLKSQKKRPEHAENQRVARPLKMKKPLKLARHVKKNFIFFIFDLNFGVDNLLPQANPGRL